MDVENGGTAAVVQAQAAPVVSGRSQWVSSSTRAQTCSTLILQYQVRVPKLKADEQEAFISTTVFGSEYGELLKVVVLQQPGVRRYR